MFRAPVVAVRPPSAVGEPLMASLLSIIKALTALTGRGIAGFLAGTVVAWYSLTFLGVLQNTRDLDQLGLDQERRGWWLVLFAACAVAVVTMLIGRVHVPKYWLSFCVAFAVMAAAPILPFKSGSLLPLATLYVNFGFSPYKAIVLAIHVALAVWAATVFQGRRRSAPKRTSE